MERLDQQRCVDHAQGRRQTARADSQVRFYQHADGTYNACRERDPRQRFVLRDEQTKGAFRVDVIRKKNNKINSSESNKFSLVYIYNDTQRFSF